MRQGIVGYVREDPLAGHLLMYSSSHRLRACLHQTLERRRESRVCLSPRSGSPQEAVIPHNMLEALYYKHHQGYPRLEHFQALEDQLMVT